MPTAVKRDGTYVWVTWLAKLLSGEVDCRFSLWFPSNFQFRKREGDFDLAKWTAEHNAMRDARVAELRGEGFAVYVENQNKFNLRGANSATLGGKADIVAIKGTDALVIDCKTGKSKTADFFQVLTYMTVLPVTVAHCKGLSLRGELQYRAERRPIPASEANPAFRTKLKEAMSFLASGDPPRKSPSWGECRFCDITLDDCPERVEKAEEVGPEGHDLF